MGENGGRKGAKRRKNVIDVTMPKRKKSVRLIITN
jgi:hypothetical protein